MKRLLIAFLLLSSSVFAQNSDWRSYRNESGTWNSYTSKWNWGEMNYADIPIIFDGSQIRLINKAMSVYNVIESEGEKEKYTDDGVRYKSISWIARDKDYRRCRIVMTHHFSEEYDPMILSIQYDDFSIRFYCRKGQLDKILN